MNKRILEHALRGAWLAVFVLLTGCSGNNPDQHLAAAKALHAKGDRNGAVLQLKSSLQQAPEHAASRFYLGLLYNESGDFRGAEKELKRALELGIDASLGMPALARSLVMQGEAKRVLAEIPTDSVRDADAVAAVLAWRGLAYLSLRQLEDARASFDKALALKPGYPDGLLGQARLLAMERKLEEGLQQVERALQGSPNNADALMLRGDFLRAMGRPDEAVRTYEQIAGLYPDHVNALLALVSGSIAAGKLDAAGVHLEAVRKASPGNPMASYFQALLDFRKGDFKAARDAIGAVLKVAPNHLPSVLLGGAVEFALGSQELAQSRLKYVLERVPSNLYARRLLIASYARAGQTHKAMELLEPVLKQGSKDPAILALAGEVHLQSNDYAKARVFFEQAAALDPKNPAMRTGLGLSRLASGEVDLATADLESASQLDASKHHADVLLISTHLQRAQFDRALKAAQGLVAKQPDSPMSYNLLAAAYIGKKDAGSARKALEKALEINPRYNPAAANLAQLDLQKGDKKAARKRFEDIIARDRANTQAYIALASLGPRIDAAAQEIKGWLEMARKESPGTIQPLVMLARFHLQAGEPKKALELMDKAMIEAPSNPEVLDLAGQVQLAAGEKNRALTTISRWVTEQPSAMSFFRMARAQIANQDLNGAINSLRKAIEYQPRFHEAQVVLAETQARLGRSTEALKVAAALQQQNPKSPVGLLLEGDIHMHAKSFATAVQAYEKAFALAASGASLIKLHAALAQSGRVADGESRLREWVKRKPNDKAVRLYFAETLLRTNKYPEAAAEYEMLDRTEPGNVVVLNNLAWCYQKLKDKRALETAEKALGLAPENSAVIDTMGGILIEQGKIERGRDLLKKAKAISPKSPEIRFHYARALVAAGDTAVAKEELERLLLDFPAFSEHGAAMKLLTALRK
ncbi:MAG: PEP-CTERM system TPR-repeat protein PrsT [Burkholderiales bacterium]|nr:PEP-CTERM system TPR-repeat protein PrsT [Burkholderiales bacterium]